MRVRLKNLHRVKKKLANGKVKIFTYLRGSRTPLPGAEGSPEFMAAYYNAVTELTAKQKAAAVSDDKVMKLIANFKASSEYTGLKLKTRKDYLTYLKLIEEEFGDMPARRSSIPRCARSSRHSARSLRLPAQSRYGLDGVETYFQRRHR